MCSFFSFVTSGNGELVYFDWTQRQAQLKSKLALRNGQTIENCDSHSEICAYYDLSCDKTNKYEFDFLTRKFTIDQINIRDDSKRVEYKVRRLNSKEICEPLIFKKIINPVKMKKQLISLREAKKLLKKWAAVRAAVGVAVWAAVGVAVWDAVGASVGVAVWDAVWAYISSFFDIEFKYDFSSCIKLCEAGYMPSYDGAIWRLHGYQGKIVYEEK